MAPYDGTGPPIHDTRQNVTKYPFAHNTSALRGERCKLRRHSSRSDVSRGL